MKTNGPSCQPSSSAAIAARSTSGAVKVQAAWMTPRVPRRAARSESGSTRPPSTTSTPAPGSRCADSGRVSARTGIPRASSSRRTKAPTPPVPPVTRTAPSVDGAEGTDETEGPGDAAVFDRAASPGRALRRPGADQGGHRPGRALLHHVQARHRHPETLAQPLGEADGEQRVPAQHEEVPVVAHWLAEQVGEGSADGLGTARLPAVVTPAPVRGRVPIPIPIPIPILALALALARQGRASTTVSVPGAAAGPR